MIVLENRSHTMGETRATIISSRTIVNIMNVTILKAETTVKSAGSDHVCECFKQINLLLLIYRFIRYVCFNLLRSAQWQYFIMLEAMRRCYPTTDQGIPSASSCNKAIEISDEEDNAEKDTDDLCYDNSWIELDGGFYDDSSSEWEIIHNNSWPVGEDNKDISSMSSRADENMFFLSCLENTDDNSEKHNPGNIYNVQRIVVKDPLEPFFEQSEIDWDAPLCDQSDEEEIDDELLHQYEEIYIDDECFASVAHCQNKSSFCTDEDFHELASDVPSNKNFTICSSVFTSDEILDADDVLPIDDEEVLAAITGVSKKHPT